MQHECGFGDVEGQERFNSMCHVVWGVTSRLPGCHTISPEDMWGDNWPLGDITIARLNEGVTDGSVRAFDDPIGM
jgi:hypothetical protein